MISSKLRGITKLYLQIFVLCLNNKETNTHLFLHCPVAWNMWNRLMAFSGGNCVVPKNVEELLSTGLWGFGRDKDKRNLWICTIFSIIWCLWLVHNTRIFRDQVISNQFLWDRIVFLATPWGAGWGGGGGREGGWGRWGRVSPKYL